MRRRIAYVVAGVVALVVLTLGGRAVLDSRSPPEAPRRAAHRTIGRDLGDALALGRARGATLPSIGVATGAIAISGTVIDAQTKQAVGSLEVVFRSELGEETTVAATDGTYRLEVPAGVYRVFVRDDLVLSVGLVGHVRLPTAPSADTIGVPDEALMPVVAALNDVAGVDLSVLRGGVVQGRVVDRAGRPVAGAVLRARGFDGVRPTLGTDLAETDAGGTYALHVSAGTYELEVDHPKFAGVSAGTTVAVAAGQRVTADVTLVAGCVIAGRVIADNGAPAGDGAIERQWGFHDHQFMPAGRIKPDGTFRWVTTDTADILLRAWPWKSPASLPQRFACTDGARFENVTFRLLDHRPDIEGVLVDAAGTPVPFAFLDLAPLDPGGISQQERTDAEGKWAVFDMPAGRYQITAHAAGRGVGMITVTAPQRDVRLALGGVGRLEGSTALLANGSFELQLQACVDGLAQQNLPEQRRLVTVTSGRFSVDDVPACELQMVASWHGHPVTATATVPAGGTGRVELAIGPPRGKSVSGLVRDEGGRPVPSVIVTAAYDDGARVTATTDATGRYQLKTFSGADLMATTGQRSGFGRVGMANVDAETVDLVLVDDDEREE